MMAAAEDFDALVYTIPQLAHELQVGQETVRRMIREDGLPVLRAPGLGRRVLIPKAGLAAWLEHHTGGKRDG